MEYTMYNRLHIVIKL